MQLSKSKKVLEALEQLGIHNAYDVLFYLPRTYLDLNPTRETDLQDKEKVVLVGKLVSSPTLVKHGKLAIVRFHFVTLANHFFSVVAFNRPYLMGQLALGAIYTLLGTYDFVKKTINLTNIIQGEIALEARLKPIYALPSTMENYQMIRLVDKAWQEKNLEIPNIIPHSFQQKYHLLDKKEALYFAHRPRSKEDIRQAYRTLKYEESLLFTLKTQWIRAQNKALFQERKKKISLPAINDFVKSLPYKLSKDQIQAVREIILDMNQDTLMYRLMQGDVGTGKTLVAAIALYGNYLRGDQGAFMAPTDALARQHEKTLKALFSKTPLRIALLVGAMTNKEKQQVKEALAQHELDLVIGTHALFSADVDFASLGLAVIDEQHRFGVNQRSLLANKGDRSDLLLMTATPIPRTLALTLYGDLDITTIQTFPFSKRDITTKVVSSHAEILSYKIKEALESNHQIYVIAPLVEANEGDLTSVLELYQKYEEEYPGKVGLLYGKLPSDEKEQVLEQFYAGEKPILISTTVIEVGIDVKNASLMLIYHANRFGLASLHQLRGRIGRDGQPACCFLLYDGEEEEEREKLAILEQSEDGFYIAEEDMKRRGPGELIGYRQSGLPDFRYVHFIDDFAMLEAARKDANVILQRKTEEENQAIIKKMLQEIEDGVIRD